MTKKDSEAIASAVILVFGVAVYALWRAGVPIELAVLIVLVVVATTFIAYVLRKRAYYRALTLSDVDNMTGIEFERYVKQLLVWRGFQVQLTPPSGDFGVDLVAQNNEEKYAVQAKCYRRQSVSVHAIGEVVGGMNHYGCSRSMVITNNHFTKPARQLAKSNNTILVDREELAQWITEYTNKTPTVSPVLRTRHRFQFAYVRIALSLGFVLVIVWFVMRPFISVTRTTSRALEASPTSAPTASIVPERVIATDTVRPTLILVPTSTPDIATATAANVDAIVTPDEYVVLYDANLRAGPSTDHEITGSAAAGASVSILPCTDECEWLQLTSGEWIAGFLVQPHPTD